MLATPASPFSTKTADAKNFQNFKLFLAAINRIQRGADAISARFGARSNGALNRKFQNAVAGGVLILKNDAPLFVDDDGCAGRPDIQCSDGFLSRVLGVDHVAPAGSPPGPSGTSTRNIASRESWASADKASTADKCSIFHHLLKYITRVNALVIDGFHMKQRSTAFSHEDRFGCRKRRSASYFRDDRVSPRTAKDHWVRASPPPSGSWRASRRRIRPLRRAGVLVIGGAPRLRRREVGPA